MYVCVYVFACMCVCVLVVGVKLDPSGWAMLVTGNKLLMWRYLTNQLSVRFFFFFLFVMLCGGQAVASELHMSGQLLVVMVLNEYLTRAI